MDASRAGNEEADKGTHRIDSETESGSESKPKAGNKRGRADADLRDPDHESSGATPTRHTGGLTQPREHVFLVDVRAGDLVLQDRVMLDLSHPDCASSAAIELATSLVHDMELPVTWGPLVAACLQEQVLEVYAAYAKGIAGDGSRSIVPRVVPVSAGGAGLSD